MSQCEVPAPLQGDPPAALTWLQTLHTMLVQLVGQPCGIAHTQAPSSCHVKAAEMVVPTQFGCLNHLAGAGGDLLREEGLEGRVMLGPVQEVVDQKPGVIGE